MNTLLINFVAYYATQVRGALGDLSQEIVDDLTDGLEADLIDALEESRRGKNAEELTLNDLIDRFGKPGDYAEELRTAAGFEPRNPANRVTVPPFLRRLRIKLVALVAPLLAAGSKFWQHEAVRRVLGFLRPLWWVWRGILAYGLIVLVIGDANLLGNLTTHYPLPDSLGTLLLMILLIVGSLHLGVRARDGRQRKREPIALLAANIVLALAVLPLTIETANLQYRSYETYVEGPTIIENYGGLREWSTPEHWNETNNFFGGDDSALHAPVMVDGELVSNLFVYDAQGNPVERAQILDQDGRPVTLSTSGTTLDRTTGTVHMWVPAVDEYGRAVPNAFPGNTWTLSKESQFCTPQDKDIWESMLGGNVFIREDGGIVDYSLENTVAQITSPKGDAIAFSSFWALSSDKLSADNGCFMGVKIPPYTGPALFPVERLAPLKALDVPVPDADSKSGEDGAAGTEAKNSDDAKSDDAKSDGAMSDDAKYDGAKSDDAKSDGAKSDGARPDDAKGADQSEPVPGK